MFLSKTLYTTLANPFREPLYLEFNAISSASNKLHINSIAFFFEVLDPFTMFSKRSTSTITGIYLGMKKSLTNENILTS